MSRIAISYRRADAAAITGRIFDRLRERYGAGGVFMDIDEIPFGIDFREHISGVLSTCDAVVVVIGQRWLGIEGGRRRIDEESDPVRVEVQAALDRKVPVIPVLVDAAAMPTAEELPEPIRALAFRNACPVDTGRDFHSHVDRLIRSMDRVLAPEPVACAAPAMAMPTGPAALERRAGAPMTLRRGAFLAGFLALPHLLQFSQRKELFLVGLFVSTVGVATILDPDDRPIATRVLTCIVVICGVVLVQAALGILRASFLTW